MTVMVVITRHGSHGHHNHHACHNQRKCSVPAAARGRALGASARSQSLRACLRPSGYAPSRRGRVARPVLTAAPARRAPAQKRLPPRPSLREGSPTCRLPIPMGQAENPQFAQRGKVIEDNGRSTGGWPWLRGTVQPGTGWPKGLTLIFPSRSRCRASQRSRCICMRNQ
jgi:hypothetical protein